MRSPQVILAAVAALAAAVGIDFKIPYSSGRRSPKKLTAEQRSQRLQQMRDIVAHNALVDAKRQAKGKKVY
jgi:hypothetical protein